MNNYAPGAGFFVYFFLDEVILLPPPWVLGITGVRHQAQPKPQRAQLPNFSLHSPELYQEHCLGKGWHLVSFSLFPGSEHLSSASLNTVGFTAILFPVLSLPIHLFIL